MSDSGNAPAGDAPLARHWPAVLWLLLVILLGVAFILLYDQEATNTYPPGFSALALAVLPNLTAAVIVALALYLLIRRDFRSSDTRRPEPGVDVNELKTVVISAVQETLPSAPADSFFKTRREVPLLMDMTEGARTVCIAAVSGLGLINGNRGLLERRMRTGTSLKVLLLNPDQHDALQTWDRLSNPPMSTPEDDIRTALRQFQQLARIPGLKGTCEIRLLKTFLPFSLIAIDPETQLGQLQLEFHSFQGAPEDRPHCLLTPKVSPHWYEHFHEQFQSAWDSAGG